MRLDWNVIFWTCTTIVVLSLIFLLVYYIYSARAMKKSREVLLKRLDAIKVGKEVLFSGGIKGKVIKVGEEYTTVEVGKGIELTISKLAVSEVLPSRKEAKKIDTSK